MIQTESTLKVLDNSGALIAKCFRILGRNEGRIGDVILLSVKTFRSGKKVKKGEVFKGIIVHTKSPLRRKVGTFIKFDYNGLILWKRKEDSPVGTRIRYIIPVELRFKGFMKIVLMSSGLV